MLARGVVSSLHSRMLRDGCVPLGRAGAVRVELHPAALFVTVAATAALARAVGSWPVAVAAGAGALAAVILHEAAHAWTARRHGAAPRRILVHLLGGTTEYDTPDGPRPDPVAELRIALAGPAASFALATGLLAACLRIADWPHAAAPAAACAVVACVGFVHGAVSLFPAYPLDGGRALRAMLWRVGGHRDRATRLAADSSRPFTVSAALAGVILAVAVHPAGLLLTLVGLYVGDRSEAVRARLAPAGSLYDLAPRRSLDAPGSPHRSDRSHGAGRSRQVTKAAAKSTTIADTPASTPKEPPVQTDRLDDVDSTTGSS